MLDTLAGLGPSFFCGWYAAAMHVHGGRARAWRLIARRVCKKAFERRGVVSTSIVTLLATLACGPATLSTTSDARDGDDSFCDAPPKCAQEVASEQARAECRRLLAGPCKTEARTNLQCLRDNELCSQTGRSDLTLALETCKLQTKAQQDCVDAAPPATDAGQDATKD